MNEKLTYYVIGSTIGAAVGYFTGAVIDEVITQRQAASHDLIDWEDREDYANFSEDEEDDEEIQIEVEPMSKKRLSKEPKDYGQYFAENGRPDLAALVDKYNGIKEEEIEDVLSDEEDDEWETVEDEIEEDYIDMGDPRIISMSEYANDSNYAHVTLLYFDEDDILTDSKRNPINRPDNLLGEDALVSFGELSEDEDIVYVFNGQKNCMYEVVRQNGWFQPPPPKRIKESKDDPDDV